MSAGTHELKGGSGARGGKILEAHESAPVSRIEGHNKDWLVVCDHASNRVPRALGSLGMPPQHLDLHIAWDIGAELVATRLASRLGAPLLASGYSRLVIDCNRYPSARDSVPAVSDHHEITANVEIDAESRRQHQMEFFRPSPRNRLGAARCRGSRPYPRIHFDPQLHALHARGRRPSVAHRHRVVARSANVRAVAQHSRGCAM